MATVQRFEDLVCWQKSRLLVKEVYQAMRGVHDPGFTDQIQRAAVSIMSNIAEGFESGTKQEFINYLYIADFARFYYWMYMFSFALLY